MLRRTAEISATAFRSSLCLISIVSEDVIKFCRRADDQQSFLILLIEDLTVQSLSVAQR